VACRLLCVLLFIGWTGEASLERDPITYEGHWRSIFVAFSPLFDSVQGLSLFPWQLLFVAMVPVCLAVRGVHSSTLNAAITASVVCVAITFLWGLLQGGTPYHAYYQVWRFLAALALALMLQSAIRNEKDLAFIGLTIVLAAIVRGVLAIYFY
jgi:hypothetical protein